MIVLDDALVRERFSAIAENIDDSDWDEVVARAGLTAHSRSVWGRSRLVPLVAGVLLGCAAIGVAFLVLGLRTSASASLPGPTKVQRHVPNGRITWLLHRLPRGQSLREAHVALGSTVGAHWQPVQFARVLDPNPASGAKIVVSLIGKHGRNICMTVFVGRSSFGGCAIAGLLRPFSLMTGGGTQVASDGGSVVAGLASDDVARMEVFLPAGRHEPVTLHDNAFVVDVPPGAWANLVAYDEHGKIIGTSTSTRLGRLP